jgi:hypothetical protein
MILWLSSLLPDIKAGYSSSVSGYLRMPLDFPFFIQRIESHLTIMALRGKVYIHGAMTHCPEAGSKQDRFCTRAENVAQRVFIYFYL